jgi:arginyl-tRNA--protein-N-Asp/Glu arginylyltransferase
MKILYSNNFGKFIKHDFTVTQITAEVANDEHLIALSQGFLWRQQAWRQCRSVRCQLNQTHYNLLDNAVILDDYDYDQLLDINKKYLTKRDYAFDSHDILIEKDDIIWGYYDNNQLIAWSRIHQYNGALETAYFAWDSADMNLRLGQRTLEHEIAWVKSLGYEYLYLGPGYESCSKYKSRIKGFEWWTGNEWSSDATKYCLLCDAETTINDFNQYQYQIYTK